MESIFYYIKTHLNYFTLYSTTESCLQFKEP